MLNNVLEQMVDLYFCLLRCIGLQSFLKCVTECFFPLCSFIKGLPVNCASLSEELKQGIGLEPMPKGINYIISTKVFTHIYPHKQLLQLCIIGLL